MSAQTVRTTHTPTSLVPASYLPCFCLDCQLMHDYAFSNIITTMSAASFCNSTPLLCFRITSTRSAMPDWTSSACCFYPNRWRGSASEGISQLCIMCRQRTLFMSYRSCRCIFSMPRSMERREIASFRSGDPKRLLKAVSSSGAKRMTFNTS
ncbi:hypothetical protein K437DRAFT_105198 [Tilletiaria anomala UBC 951]|uniref:Uncharacterized protein n=1 Tax=Tilletiaria anomala (strain ATCC 24038 / CBS 436.72 / UBC 951) TaxID=1037660 RepID=A0A066VZB6_TILAU|nr:uncharacterized protein K437DRAFT_105198 [Tilletiaria anomala UBC 951]KDN46821.1 hypothetical protein K437DRAFT_105198 [Tilletiaria anomala UBC 951]